ncbi:MAG TPA: MraY family glycosyltransferase [Balneolales bacterium]|nr:MraY family glycosyltransferase [Balneolales bacterium]
MNMWVIDPIIIGAAIITSLTISYISMPVIIKVDNMKRFMDEPDHDRKLHEKIIPTLGGLGIFASFLIAYSIWGDANNLQSYPFFVASLVMLFIIGLKDDILMLSPVKKLMVQILSAAIVVWGGNMQLTDFSGILGIHEIPLLIGQIFSVLIIVTIINAFNLIDGIDGLAGGIGIISSGFFGIWFWSNNYIHFAVLAFVLTGALVGFLIFNFSPAKIFMGDTGSMIVGFIIAYMTLHFLNLNKPINNSYSMVSAPVIAIAVLIIPLFDTFRIFFWRIIKGKSPFIADNNHIHHIMLRSGYTHASASITLWSINILIISITLYLRGMDVNILFMVNILMALLIIPTLRVCGKLYRFTLINHFPVNDQERIDSGPGYDTSENLKEINGHGIKNGKIPELKDS